MNATELMKPRFEVIADYPFNPHKIGDILISPTGLSIHQTTTPYRSEFGDCAETHNFCNPDSFEKYPHLFRKLNWWEHRKDEDMPKRLISKATPNDTNVFEIEGWDMINFIGWIDKEERSCCSLLSWNPEYGYFPID